MKKQMRWLAAGCGAVLLAGAILLAGGLTREKGTTLILGTDLHYLSEQLNDHGACFEKTILNGDGKAMEYIDQITDAFLAQVIQEQPAALILSGDLTLNGELQSHLDLAEKLQGVEEAGVPVLVIPGNHDLNSGNAVRFTGKTYERTDNIKSKRFAKVYENFGYGEALSRDEASLSYMYQIQPGLRMLMLDVNVPDWQGALLEETYQWAEEQLRQAQEAGERVIAVSHQNVLQHSPQFDGGFVIYGAEELIKLYENYDVICNLSGHMHVQHTGQSESGFWEAATSSLAVSPNQYARIGLTDRQLRYETQAVDVSGWAKARGSSDANLLDFETYAADFFKEVNRNKVLGSLEDEPDGQQMADFFAAINLDYFRGRPDAYDHDDPLFDRWQEVDLFMTSAYVESMRQEPEQDHTQYTLKL